MRIATIGRGSIGGTLARLWRAAGHEVTELGRDGGDVAGAEVVILAMPSSVVEEALNGITGLDDQVVIDATNRLQGEPVPGGQASVAEYAKTRAGGPVAKAFNLNFGKLFGEAAAASARPNNIWVGDEGARAAVEALSRDIGMEPLNGGPLEHASIQEAFAKMLMGFVRDADDGLLFYRFAAPRRF